MAARLARKLEHRNGYRQALACWAHARRKFFDLARLQKAPIASWVGGIRQLISRSIANSASMRLTASSPRYRLSMCRTLIRFAA